MIAGLDHWIANAKAGNLAYGYLTFQKRPAALKPLTQTNLKMSGNKPPMTRPSRIETETRASSDGDESDLNTTPGGRDCNVLNRAEDQKVLNVFFF